MPILMGVDGGGSKTYSVITDEHGYQLGKGISSGANYQTIGIDKAIKNIKDSIESALMSASLKYDDIDYVQYGLAGADREKDLLIINEGLRTINFQNWGLVCDTMEGLRIGSPDYTGVVLVCGTGTNAAGRNKLGQMVQIGGLGNLYGDGAGGSSMAEETFRAAIRSWELRERPTILTKTVPSYFGFENVPDMFNTFLDDEVYNVPNELTIVLHQAAYEGDEVAIRILEETGKELGLAASSVIHKLGNLEEPTPIVLTGSVLQKGQSKHLLESLRSTVESVHEHIKLVIPKMEPVYGSLLLAMDHLGITVTEEIHQKFNSYGGYEQ
ncbi:N-acetylglucosamine kinase [Bacillus sp. FSL K6-3431]|uniref:N-acetylglucosamine kinase n=1 Tax=Bacillus sp. FSL K6-3431 TaxID=2921500 RepID=UPI0030FB9F9C